MASQAHDEEGDWTTGNFDPKARKQKEVRSWPRLRGERGGYTDRLAAGLGPLAGSFLIASRDHATAPRAMNSTDLNGPAQASFVDSRRPGPDERRDWANDR